MTTEKLNATLNETFTHQFAEVNGFNLHYVIEGKGEALVLLHGWPQTWYAFRHIIPELSKRFTVIVPDLRGLGDSEKHSSGYDIYTVADDIYKLVQHLGYKEINLLGHDFGANVAYAYAASHREEVRKLVFLDVGIMDSSLEKIPLIAREGKSLWWFPFHMLRDLPEELIKGNEAVYLNWFYKNATYNQSAFSAQDINEYVRCYSKPEAMKTSFEYYRNILKNIDNNNVQSKIKLQMHVLALGGDKSFGMKPYYSWSTVAGNVKGDVIENCGHHIAEEQPEALLQQLKLFMQW